MKYTLLEYMCVGSRNWGSLDKWKWQFFLKNNNFLVDLEYLFIFVLMVGNVVSRCGELFPDVFRHANFWIFENFWFLKIFWFFSDQWKSMKINENQWKSMEINGPKKNIKSSKIKIIQNFQKCSCRKTSGNNSEHLENTFPTIRTVPKYYSRSTKKFNLKKNGHLEASSLAALHTCELRHGLGSGD